MYFWWALVHAVLFWGFIYFKLMTWLLKDRLPDWLSPFRLDERNLINQQCCPNSTFFFFMTFNLLPVLYFLFPKLLIVAEATATTQSSLHKQSTVCCLATSWPHKLLTFKTFSSQSTTSFQVWMAQTDSTHPYVSLQAPHHFCRQHMQFCWQRHIFLSKHTLFLVKDQGANLFLCRPAAKFFAFYHTETEFVPVLVQPFRAWCRYCKLVLKFNLFYTTVSSDTAFWLNKNDSMSADIDYNSTGTSKCRYHSASHSVLITPHVSLH